MTGGKREGEPGASSVGSESGGTVDKSGGAIEASLGAMAGNVAFGGGSAAGSVLPKIAGHKRSIWPRANWLMPGAAR